MQQNLLFFRFAPSFLTKDKSLNDRTTVQQLVADERISLSLQGSTIVEIKEGRRCNNSLKLNQVKVFQ